MKKIELLAPAGDFDSLISAVQNGADAVYFGANKFNARINSKNFDGEELEKAINYAKLRNVKTHLTLNILIKNDEFEEAISIVNFAYKAGIDAVIVQDLGLASKIHELFPDLELHSSTQMTNYNLNGVKQMEKLGFKRVVLAREVNIEKIKEITKNTNLDIEIFGHGALCISYSGQCLMSSIIGGRSGNRGKCAGTCRLPYELIEKNGNKIIEKGYLLSSKDVCFLEILPEIIKSGVTSLKLEGRMKSSDYVGVVTSIYRKYIDLYYSGKEYKVENEDKEKLQQIFNRGGFSTGFIKNKLGKEMMYIKKPNHLGIYIGEVISYNSNKGYVKFKTIKPIDMGDCIAINTSSCKISELMIDNKNIKEAKIGNVITTGRIKGKVNKGDKIYKTVSVRIQKELIQNLRKENRKRDIFLNLTNKNEEIILKATDITTNLSVTKKVSIDKSIKNEIIEERAKNQLLKTGNTVFNVKQIDINTKLFIKISSLNELRRNALNDLEERLINNFKRQSNVTYSLKTKISVKNNTNPEVSLLLNYINNEIDYSFIKNVNRVYLPIKLFHDKLNIQKLKQLIFDFDAYVYLPAISNESYNKFIKKVLQEYNFKGIVISNLSQIELIENDNLDIIANYNLNLSNNFSVDEIREFGIKTYTISPEMDKQSIMNLKNDTIKKEAIVYGRTLMMNTEYCTIGKYINCDRKCQKGKYVLKDRMGFEFPVYTDIFNCNNYIYNSKITSIVWNDLNLDSIRIDILDETEDEIKNIINVHKKGKRLEGENYTNGNLNKEI
ncbi:MAG: DUF3656 domain-containing protein [Anaeroplasma sp.]